MAIIGLGTVGLRYVEQFEVHPDFEVIAGFDHSKVACQTAVERFDVSIVERAETLITDPGVDIVYVAVPPLHHAHYVELVVDAGKALLCEKPLGVDDAESASLVELVANAGIPAAVNYVFGAAPSAVAMVRDVRRTPGPLHGVDLRVHFEDWPRAWQAGAGWLRDRDQGGWTREVISHYVFLILRLLGTPTVEQCVAEFGGGADGGESEERLTASLRADGVPITIVGSSDSAGADEVEFTVRNPERSWRLTNWYEYAIAERGGPWVDGIDLASASGPAAYAAQLEQLADLIEGQTNTLATFTEALAVQRVVEQMLTMASEATA